MTARKNEIVEAMAQQGCDRGDPPGVSTWSALSELAKEEWRLDMRAALRALPSGVVLVDGVPPPVTEIDAPKCMQTIDGLAWSLGHFYCRAKLLARVVEVGE